MATRMQQRRGTAAQWISTNAGAGPVLNAGEIGWESDTNKFKIGDGVNNWSNLDYFADSNSTINPSFGSSITFEGATADSYETTLQVTDPTADRTITFPDATGTVALTSDIAELSQDAIDSALTAGTGITKTYNDAANTLTLAVDTTAIQAKVTNVSDTEIGYLDGVTSSIQTQLNDKLASATASTTYAPLASPTFTGTVTLPSGTVTSTMIANGTIADADINASAAIALSKLATDPLARANHTGSQAASTISDFNEAAQDAIGTILGTGLSYNDAGPGIGIDNAGLSTYLLDGVSGSSYGLIGTSAYLDIKNTNGYNKEIELDIAAVETKLETDGFAKLAGPTFTGTVSAANLTLSGDLTVNGTTTTINSTTLAVDDKNIVLGDVATPTDTTADGGGITLKGTTDKTFNWVDATDAWTSSEHINLASGKTLKYNGTDLVASQSGNSGKYLTTDGTSTSWGTVSGYSAPTIGSTSIGSGATVTTIAGLTLTTPTIGNFILGYTTTATAAGTTTLTNTSNNQQVFTGVTTQTVVMPVASTMTVGTRYLIENNSTGNLTVNSSGGNLIATVYPGMSIKVTSILASGTSAASWDAEYVGFNAVTGTGSAVLGTSPTISGLTLTGTLTAGASVGTSGQVLQSTGTGVQWATSGGGAAFSEFMLIGA